jgi:exopolysaccharide biosynthesis protein
MSKGNELFQEPARASAVLEDWSPQWENLTRGIDIGRGKIENPRLMFYFLRIDLDAGFKITLNEPSAEFGAVESVFVSTFARQHGCIAAINASPFDVVNAKEGETRHVIGVFITEGLLWQNPNPSFAAIVFKTDGSADIVEQSQINDSLLEHIENAVGGFRTTLQDGKPTERVLESTVRHPRTAIGLSHKGRTLYMLAVDGRRTASVGATEKEVAMILAALGAEQGLNMDGGGSTALALNGRLVNHPVHRPFPLSLYSPHNERAVAACIGVTRL